MKNESKQLFLISTLKVFLILFFSSLIMRIMGLDKFGINDSNKIVLDICNFINKNIIINQFFSFIILSITSFLIFKLVCFNKNIIKYYIISCVISIINLGFQLFQIYIIKQDGFYISYSFVSVLLLLIGILIIDKKIPIKKTLLIFGINIIYQIIAQFIRDVTYTEHFYIIYDLLLNFDYILLLTITYIVYSLRGSDDKWWVLDLEVVGLFLPLPIFLRKLVTKSPTQLLTKEEKREKLSEIIYLILSLIWNLFTLICVIFISTLNTTFVTTIFILTAFLATKSTFGEAFHMKNALACFIVSNLTYFAISRITVSINTSFLIPILLGIGLSYVTSLLVKTKNIDLYKGIEENILRNYCLSKKLNSYEINLLVDFYSNRMTLVKLANKYNYSKDTIFIHKKKAIQKLKGL